MTNEQLQQIDQARRYAEQDEYVVTRTHIRNLLAIIEQQNTRAAMGELDSGLGDRFKSFGDLIDEAFES